MIGMKSGITFFICSIFFLAGNYCAFAQNTASQLKEKRITMKFKQQPLWRVFARLIVEYDIAIGFEESTLDRDHNDYEFVPNVPFIPKNGLVATSGVPVIEKHWFTVEIENERLEDVLNLITGQMKNYKWEIADDVVNIFPIRGREPRYEEFLKVKVKKFTLKKNEPIFLVRTKIFELPEVIGFLSENHLKSSMMKGDFNFTTRPFPVELDFSHLTTRELLNKTTKVKRGGWILKQSDVVTSTENEFIDIEI